MAKLTTARPSDVYEHTISVTGTPGATVLLGIAYGTSGGVMLWPITQTVTLDGQGNGTIVAVAAAFYPAGSLALGATVTWTAPPGLDSTGTVASSQLAPATTYLRKLTRAAGTAWQTRDGSLIAELLRAVGKVLADAESTLTRALAQAFPDTATDLLSEWEARLGLPVDPYGDTATRQTGLLAAWRARARATAIDIIRAVQTIDTSAAMHENSATAVTAAPRNVHLFAVQLTDAIWRDAALRKAIQALLQRMKPAHADVTTPVTVGFLTDDPDSLTDRDVLAH